MQRLMFVTPPIGAAPGGGRELLSKLHRDCLQSLLGGALKVFELPAGPAQGLNALAGRIDGATAEAEGEILRRVREESITRIFLNGSNLGRLARAIKRAAPAGAGLVPGANLSSTAIGRMSVALLP
jgi:hypothetical protein